MLYHGTGDDIHALVPYAWAGPFEWSACPHPPLVKGHNIRKAERLSAQRLTPRGARVWKSDAAMRSTVYSHALAQGYDGVVFRGVRDDPGVFSISPLTDIYAFFETARFKSATGNKGDFDPECLDICR